jgi:hypothetical protein
VNTFPQFVRLLLPKKTLWRTAFFPFTISINPSAKGKEWDQQLTEWNLAIQRAMHPGAKVTQDGIVDPARGTSTHRTTFHRGLYTSFS